ncbi:MAG: SUMF1/EgtB/PvdO family nonheme iron enzyme [Bryobacteraceae bacterium]
MRTARRQTAAGRREGVRGVRQVVVLFIALAPVWAQAPKPKVRVLIIANQNYTKLAPIVDAEASATRVRKALADTGLPGVSITVRKDQAFAQIKETLEDQFVPSIQPGEVAIVYFIGHMIQADGENYLLGPSFDPSATGPLRNTGYLYGRFLDLLQSRSPSFSLLLFEGAFADGKLALVPGYTPGLHESPDVANGIVLYSAAREQLAPVPKAATPSLFAESFANLLGNKGIGMQTLAIELQKLVDQSSKGVQSPYLLAHYTGDFKFTDAPIVKPPEPIVKIVRTGGPERKQHPLDREFYVLIPGGKFQMGCVDVSGCEDSEKPRHEVTISKPFWMGESELTVEAYERYTKMTNHKMPGAPLGPHSGWKDRALPMVMVSWTEAEQYCGWLGGRLPTEAEWEYAARGKDADQIYPMKDFAEARDAANFKGKSGNDLYDDVAPVRKFDKNSVGLYDMAGNVWEWVSDLYGADYYASSPAADPKGLASGNRRVIRGGSYDSDPKVHLRLSYRRQEKPDGARYIGFRCLLPDTPAVREKLQ